MRRSNTSRDAKCYRTHGGQYCQRRLSEHVPNGSGELFCPSGSGKTFLPHTRKGVQASNSFSADEVALLDQVTNGIARGADLRVLARNPAFASIARKVMAMKATISRGKAEAAE